MNLFMNLIHKFFCFFKKHFFYYYVLYLNFYQKNVISFTTGMFFFSKKKMQNIKKPQKTFVLKKKWEIKYPKQIIIVHFLFN